MIDRGHDQAGLTQPNDPPVGAMPLVESGMASSWALPATQNMSPTAGSTPSLAITACTWALRPGGA